MIAAKSIQRASYLVDVVLSNSTRNDVKIDVKKPPNSTIHLTANLAANFVGDGCGFPHLICWRASFSCKSKCKQYYLQLLVIGQLTSKLVAAAKRI